MLCDAASVREGLLNVLSAGVTTLSVQDLPSNLPLIFAVRLVLEPREVKSSHTIRVELSTDQDATIATLEVLFQVADKLPPTEEVALSAPVSLAPFQISHGGRYLLKASFDERVLGTYPLKVTAG